MIWWTVLLIPFLNQRNVNASARHTRPLIKRMRSPVQRDAVGGIVRVQRSVGQEWLHFFWKLKVFIQVLQLHLGSHRRLVICDRIDQWVEVKARQVWVFSLDVSACRVMVDAHVHFPWSRIVQIWECNPVFRSNLLANNNLVDVIEFIPVLLINVVIAIQRFEFRTSRNRDIESLGSIKRWQIEKIEVVPICKIRQQLRSQTVEGSHDRDIQTP
mmetsp:Transcript_27924/g.90698  ORF Transcript_27924/g.90698 Transcript_27924/m.90698 type:complete len:214 (-) Transcript_27924:799-1440(-)